MENTNVNVNEQTVVGGAEGPTVKHTEQEPVVKTFTQEEVDKIIAKRISRERKDIEAKIEAERQEAERLAKLSEAERQKAMFEKQVAEFEATKRAFEQEKLLNETVKQLASRNLPIEFADILKAQDAESTLENINKFEEKFNAALEAKVNDRLKGNTPKSSTNKSLEITKEAFKKMSLVKQAEIAKTKPELYKKLTER